MINIDKIKNTIRKYNHCKSITESLPRALLKSTLAVAGITQTAITIHVNVIKYCLMKTILNQ